MEEWSSSVDDRDVLLDEDDQGDVFGPLVRALALGDLATTMTLYSHLPQDTPPLPSRVVSRLIECACRHVKFDFVTEMMMNERAKGSRVGVQQFNRWLRTSANMPQRDASLLGETFNVMQELGVKPDFHSLLVASEPLLYRDPEQAAQLIMYYRERWNGTPSTFHVQRLVSRLYERSRANLFPVMRRLQQSGVELRAVHFHDLSDKLAVNDQADQLLKLMENMKSELGITPSASSLQHLATAALSRRHAQALLFAVNEMLEVGQMAPPEAAVKTLVNLLEGRQRKSDARDILTRSLALRQESGSLGQYAALKALGEGNLAEVERITFDTLRRHHTPPSHTILVPLVADLVGRGQVRKIVELLASAFPLPPPAHSRRSGAGASDAAGAQVHSGAEVTDRAQLPTYMGEMLMNATLKTSPPEEVVHVVTFLHSRGWSCDAPRMLLHVAEKSFAVRKQQRAAYQSVQALLDMGVPLSNSIWAQVLYKAAERKQGRAISTVLQRLREVSQLKEVHLEFLLRGCLKHPKPMLLLMDVMEAHKHDVSPTSSMLTLLLHACAKRQNLRESVKILNIARTHPDVFAFPLSAAHFDVVLMMYARLTTAEHTLRFFELYRVNNVEPTTNSYNALLLANQRERNLKAMWVLLEEMKRQDVPRDEFSYNRLLSVVAASGDEREFERAMQSMREDHVNENAFTAESRVELLCAKGEVRRAHDYCLRHRLFSSRCYSMLVKAYAKEEGVQRGLRFVREDMRREGATPTSHTYEILLEVANGVRPWEQRVNAVRAVVQQLKGEKFIEGRPAVQQAVQRLERSIVKGPEQVSQAIRRYEEAVHWTPPAILPKHIEHELEHKKKDMMGFF